MNERLRLLFGHSRADAERPRPYSHAGAWEREQAHTERGARNTLLFRLCLLCHQPLQLPVILPQLRHLFA